MPPDLISVAEYDRMVELALGPFRSIRCFPELLQRNRFLSTKNDMFPDHRRLESEALQK